MGLGLSALVHSLAVLEELGKSVGKGSGRLGGIVRELLNEFDGRA